jgi:hypothetical protein
MDQHAVTTFVTVAAACKWMATRCFKSVTSVAARSTRKSLIAAHAIVMLIVMTGVKMMWQINQREVRHEANQANNPSRPVDWSAWQLSVGSAGVAVAPAN